MAVFGTANGSPPGRCGQSFDSIPSEVTKGNQLEVLSKKSFREIQSRNQKTIFKNRKIIASWHRHRRVHSMPSRHHHRTHLMIFRILELIFSTNKHSFLKNFFAQNLKLVPLSNPKKYRIKTLTTAPRRRPVCCIKNGHIWFLLGLTQRTSPHVSSARLQTLNIQS